jgi:NDP-sugar pyrophosphorylase family protein
MIIVMPMAGRGSRFSGSGIIRPKPLIEVAGKPMFLHAFASLEGLEYSSLIFIVLAEHEEQYGIQSLIATHFDERAICITIPRVTEGQLCTVMEAQEFLSSEESVIIAASDTYTKSNLKEDLSFLPEDAAGLISVADLSGEQWSFARTDENGLVIEVAEKKRISDHASTGIYYFSSGLDLINFGQNLIESGERTRGEFYIIPVFQKMINTGKKIYISKASEMWDMGTPESKLNYENYLLGS